MDLEFENPDNHNLDEFIKVDGMIFQDIYEPEEVKLERLTTYPSGCYLARDGEKPVGVLTTELWSDFHEPRIGSRAADFHDPQGKILYVTSFGLLNDYRGKGLGMRMVDLMKDHLEKHGLKHIYLRTSKARAFYEKAGFECLKTCRDEDGHYDIMKYTLNKG